MTAMQERSHDNNKIYNTQSFFHSLRLYITLLLNNKELVCVKLPAFKQQQKHTIRLFFLFRQRRISEFCSNWIVTHL